ncbi:UNVERIFIED_CONTAM: hypothetical protein FKN15_030914 [Acipenser sinensis]
MKMWKENRGAQRADTLSTGAGVPVGDKLNSLTAGPRGPLLVQDVVFTDEMAHFDRERIPERVVHAKGAGAFGYFEVTHDITKYTKAKIFEHVGKRTPTAVRFSTVAGEAGSADTVRDPRGFAVKFYTEEGNWDLTGNNTPIFFIRDPLLVSKVLGLFLKLCTGNNERPLLLIMNPWQAFPSFVHSQKRNPQTHLKDPDMVWDFWSLRPESLHQVTFLFGDRGIPDGHRHMNGYGSHTFKLVNNAGQAVYCKFHFKEFQRDRHLGCGAPAGRGKTIRDCFSSYSRPYALQRLTDQGIKNIPVDEASRLSSTNPDYGIQDLYNAIANGNYPSWSVFIQVMTFEQAEQFRWNPFDLTKVWSHKDFPLIPVGKLMLNRNPVNYFAEVEQLAFDPSNMPPGIEPSPDKMLQGRLFSYPDTHRHRLGANYLQIPVNCPYKTRVANYQRDGPMCMFDNQGGAPNYYPNSFSAPDTQPQFLETKFRVSADVARFNSSDDDNVTQVRNFYTQVLNEEERQRLCENIAGHLKEAQLFIQKRGAPNYYPNSFSAPDTQPQFLETKFRVSADVARFNSSDDDNVTQVKNFMDVHPDYGSRIQALLDKYNTQAGENVIRTYAPTAASLTARESKM